MKKNIITYIILLIVVGIGALFYIYWTRFRGVWPAITPPPDDIAELIEKGASKPSQNGTETLQLPKNKTEFPLILPDGFSISIFARNLENPRVLAFDEEGTLLVSIPKQGKVVALPDKNGDGVADEVITVYDKLNRPHGLAFYCTSPNPSFIRRGDCKLYIAESDQVARYDYNPATKSASNKEKILDLPDGGRHFTRTILFKDDLLFISVGSSCDTCIESDWRRAAILQAKPDGSGFKHFAKGLRNSVFMTLHPITSEIFATEMGRDNLGDDLPPDEINIIEEGKDYGWSYCYGKQIHDTIFNKEVNPCLDTIPSYINIPAHSAPLGLAFFPKEGWGEEYHDDLLVAYHGSWNRTEPTGYKIVRYKLDENGNYEGEEDFITGWLRDDNTALGRPVDIKIMTLGIIYISDDKAGVIYKVTYGK